MRDSSEFDEVDDEVSDRLYSLKELMEAVEVEEVEEDEGIMSEEERKEFLREVHSIPYISPKTGIEIDPEEVCRLYVEEDYSLRKLGKHYGFKDGRKTMKRILKSCGVEIRSVGFQEIEIDREELYQLYFGEGRGLNECAKHFGCKSTDPVLRVFKEEGWTTRYQETYEKEIDPEEVFRLYDEWGSIRKIGDHYGVSYGRIHRVFEEHGKEYGQEIQVDHEDIHRLYFGEGLSRDEVCETLGFSRRVFDRVFREQEWEARPIGFQPVEIDIEEFKKVYYDEELQLNKMAEYFGVSVSTLIRFRKEHDLKIRDRTTVRELRNRMFGIECVTCGKKRKFIHRKDGEEHPPEILWSKKELSKLNPDDWAALCAPCHRLFHSIMRNYGREWDEIAPVLKELAKKRTS